MGRRRGIRLLGLVWLVACPMRAAADGKGFPAQAFADIPKIPAQRAIIVWKDGVETLVVESTMETPSPDLGWVLPLPAEPTKLDVAHAGILTSMSYSQAPKIINDLGYLWEIPLVAAIVLVPAALITIFVRDARKRRRARTAVMAGVVLGLLVWGTLLAPMLGPRSAGAGSAASTGVEIVASTRVGNYEATVLRARTPDALDAWLTGSGLRGLDAADRRAVDDYIARKWCFVVARLRKDVAQATPHPIQATFPAASPVYPMKLTGLSGSSKTRVELFVIAEHQARAEHFDCIAADGYRQEWGDSRVATHYYVSKYDDDLIVGSLDACELMWPGCVVTALAAELTPQQMDRDVELSLVPLEPSRQIRYTVGARRDVVAAILAAGFLAVLVVAAGVCKGRRLPGRRTVAILAGLSVAALAASAAVGWSLPTIPTRTSVAANSVMISRMPHRLSRAVMVLEADGLLHAPPEDKSLPAILDLLVEHGLMSAAARNNPFTGEPIRPERSPGNCTIRVIKGRPSICCYDVHGREFHDRLPTPMEE